MPEPATVVAVCRDGEHRFSKAVIPSITLLEGLGVEGDAHAGVTVRHRSRVAQDPTQPNLRQVHLMHEELFEELAGAGRGRAWRPDRTGRPGRGGAAPATPPPAGTGVTRLLVPGHALDQPPVHGVRQQVRDVSPVRRHLLDQ